MSAWTPSNEQRDKERFWRTKPKDPTAAFRKSGVPYYRPGKQRVLMPDDFMPLGPHAGKHMRAVPTDYLLWVNAQPWAANWPHWQPIADYISRCIIIFYDPPATTAIFFVDRLRQWPTPIKCFRAGSSHLHTLPGWEDHLHTFALGALGLQRSWYQNGKGLPHYDLTFGKHHQALKHPCVQQIPDEQMISNKTQWLQFFRTQPKLPQ